MIAHKQLRGAQPATEQWQPLLNSPLAFAEDGLPLWSICVCCPTAYPLSLLSAPNLLTAGGRVRNGDSFDAV